MTHIKTAEEKLKYYLKDLEGNFNQFAIERIAEKMLPRFQIEEVVNLRTALEQANSRIANLEAALSAVPAQEPVMDITFSQFLFDVHTAAGLVSHGKQCKALGERLGKYVMRYRELAQEPVKRLQAAIEGELNGLAIDKSTASKILAYVQEPVKPAGFITAKTGEWLNTIGEMIDAKMELTFRTEPSVEPYTIPFYLAPQEPVKQESKPVAYEVRAYNRTQQLVVREDVAQELADKYNSNGYEYVEVRALTYVTPPVQEVTD